MSIFGVGGDWQDVIQGYNDLLAVDHNEQIYQSYLEEHPVLIPQEFLLNHGLHFDLVLRKVPIGSDYCCDFMYLTKSTVRWHCVLVEIEKPTSRYFKTGSLDFHPNFQSACEQINDWRAWFENESNKNSFLSNAVGFLKTPISHTPVDMKYVLVHGRGAEIGGNAMALAKVRGLERSDFRIMTFDSLTVGVPRRYDLYMGRKRNEFIEIMSKNFVGESIFSWLNPEMIRVNKSLWIDIEGYRGKINAFRMRDGKSVRSIDYYLDNASKP